MSAIVDSEAIIHARENTNQITLNILYHFSSNRTVGQNTNKKQNAIETKAIIATIKFINRSYIIQQK